MPKVHILTPVHNRKATTSDFTKCLLLQSYKNFQYYLIDDGSTDGTAEAVRALMPNVEVLTGKGDWWWGGSLHQGYLKLKSLGLPENDIVLLINDDVYFGPQYLQTAVALVKEDPNQALCSRYYDQSTGQILDRGAKCDFETFNISAAYDDSEIAFLSTRGLFITMKDFINSDGFVPEKVPHYLSDYEFTFRLNKKLGLKLVTSDKIPLFGNSEQSGVSDVRFMTPLKAYKTIFSHRYHLQPVFVSNFIRLCVPEQFQKVHIKNVWFGFARTWRHTFPVWLMRIALLVWLPLKGILQGIKAFLTFRNATAPIQVKVTKKVENNYHEFLSYENPDEEKKVRQLLGSTTRSNKVGTANDASFFKNFTRHWSDVLAKQPQIESTCELVTNDIFLEKLKEKKIDTLFSKKANMVCYGGVLVSKESSFLTSNIQIGDGLTFISSYSDLVTNMTKNGFKEVFAEFQDRPELVVGEKLSTYYGIYRKNEDMKKQDSVQSI